MPQHVLITRSAAELSHGQRILDRCLTAGIDDVQLLPGDRLPSLLGDDARATYVRAKSTLAVVVAPPSKRTLQPIPPSADWRVDLAQGCPAHCQYCYLAGSRRPTDHPRVRQRRGDPRRHERARRARRRHHRHRRPRA